MSCEPRRGQPRRKAKKNEEGEQLAPISRCEPISFAGPESSEEVRRGLRKAETEAEAEAEEEEEEEEDGASRFSFLVTASRLSLAHSTGRDKKGLLSLKLEARSPSFFSFFLFLFFSVVSFFFSFFRPVRLSVCWKLEVRADWPLQVIAHFPSNASEPVAVAVAPLPPFPLAAASASLPSLAVGQPAERQRANRIKRDRRMSAASASFHSSGSAVLPLPSLLLLLPLPWLVSVRSLLRLPARFRLRADQRAKERQNEQPNESESKKMRA